MEGPLWFITDSNLEVQNINVSQNDISWEDVPGMARMLVTCPKLTKFDISSNQLSTLVETHFSGFHRMCEALANNRSLPTSARLHASAHRGALSPQVPRVELPGPPDERAPAAAPFEAIVAAAPREAVEAGFLSSITVPLKPAPYRYSSMLLLTQVGCLIWEQSRLEP